LCRKLLLSNWSAQQQHDAAVAALQAAGASPADLVSAIVGSGSAANGAGSSKKQQSMLSGISRLWGADKTTSSSSSSSSGSGSKNATPASSALPASSQQNSAAAAPGVNESAGSSIDSGRVGKGLDASDVVWAAQLDAAMACEVQLLSDMCVSSLRHIHKLAALSTLMEDFW
jgi:hypothetical protein